MPIRKIDGNETVWQQILPCYSPDHNVPNMQVFENGTYEHECSACRRKTIFTVNKCTL